MNVDQYTKLWLFESLIQGVGAQYDREQLAKRVAELEAQVQKPEPEPPTE